MNSNECWAGLHEFCPVPDTCDCLCHAVLDELIEELQHE